MVDEDLLVARGCGSDTIARHGTRIILARCRILLKPQSAHGAAPARSSPRSPGAFTALSLLPLLLLVALLVQSLAESRLLIEYGLFTLVIIAVKTKLGDRALLV